MASRRETDAVEGRGRGSGGARAAVFVRSVVVSDEWHLILGIASQSPAARFPTLPMASCPARPAPATSQGSGLACEGTTPSHVQMHRSSYPCMHRLDSSLSSCSCSKNFYIVRYGKLMVSLSISPPSFACPFSRFWLLEQNVERLRGCNQNVSFRHDATRK